MAAAKKVTMTYTGRGFLKEGDETIPQGGSFEVSKERAAELEASAVSVIVGGTEDAQTEANGEGQSSDQTPEPTS